MSKLSLKTLLIFLLLTATLIPFFVNSVVTVSATRTSTLQEEQQKLAAQAFSTANSMQAKFGSYEALLKLLSTSPNINNYKTFKDYNLLIKLQLQEIVATHPEFANLFVVTEGNDHFYYRDPSTPPGNDTQTDWYQAARQAPKKVLWDTGTTFDKTTNNWTKMFRMGYKNGAAAEFAGVVSVQLKLDAFSEELRKLSENDHMTRVIVSEDHIVVASSDPSWIGSEFPSGKTDSSEDRLREIRFAGDSYYGSMEQLPSFGLQAAVLQTKAATLAHLNQMLKWNWIMIGLVSVVYLIAAIFLSTFIVRPIKEIYRSLESIGNKDFTVRELNAGASVSKEFKFLKTSFNSMYGSYKEIIRSVIVSTAAISAHSDKLKSQAEITSSSVYEAGAGISHICSGSTENAIMAEKGLSLTNELTGKIEESLRTFEHISSIVAQASGFNQDTKNSTEELIVHTRLSHSCSMQVLDSVSALLGLMDAIHTILDHMDNISKETTILSLNASIEAVRAGESGKGFAAVARHIRELSAKSRDATEQILTIVGSIESHSQAITSIANDLRATSDKQLDFVENNRKTIMRNLNAFEEVIHEIDTAKGQNVSMANSISVLADMMQSTAAISEQTAAMTEQLSAAMESQVRMAAGLLESSSQMRDLTDSLNHTTGSFKLP